MSEDNSAVAVAEKRDPNQTTFELDAPGGGKVYLVGTAHFSVESQQEVAELIRRVRPHYVVLELCSSRQNILKMDEVTILREAKEMSTARIIQLMKQTSVIHGLLQSLLINLYAKVTKELGLAPGGEFRVAYNEASQIPNCKVILGDLPINITLSRGFNSLPWYRKIKLGFALLTTNPKITKEDIEALKKSDMLDALLQEFGASFPEFKKVLIDERNIYLTHSLHSVYQPIANDFVPGGFVPARVVGVVGLGHCTGIIENWLKENNVDEILKVPKKSNFGKYLKYSLLFGVSVFMMYRVLKQRRHHF